jgi:hypothetical protein
MFAVEERDDTSLRVQAESAELCESGEGSIFGGLRRKLGCGGGQGGRSCGREVGSEVGRDV